MDNRNDEDNNQKDKEKKMVNLVNNGNNNSISRIPIQVVREQDESVKKYSSKKRKILINNDKERKNEKSSSLQLSTTKGILNKAQTIDNNTVFITHCKEELNKEVGKRQKKGVIADKAQFDDRMPKKFGRFFRFFTLYKNVDNRIEEPKDNSNFSYIFGTEICKEMAFSKDYAGLISGIFVPEYILQDKPPSHLYKETRIYNDESSVFICFAKLKSCEDGTFMEQYLDKNNQEEIRMNNVCNLLTTHFKNLKDKICKLLFGNKKGSKIKMVSFLYKDEEKLNKSFSERTLYQKKNDQHQQQQQRQIENSQKFTKGENLLLTSWPPSPSSSSSIHIENTLSKDFCPPLNRGYANFKKDQESINEKDIEDHFALLPISVWIEKTIKYRREKLFEYGAKYFSMIFLYPFYGEDTESYRFINDAIVKENIKIFPLDCKQRKLSKEIFFVSIELAVFLIKNKLLDLSSNIFTIISETHKQKYLFTGNLFSILLSHEMNQVFLEIMNDINNNSKSKFKTDEAKIRLFPALEEYMKKYDKEKSDERIFIFLFKYCVNPKKFEYLEDLIMKSEKYDSLIFRLIERDYQDYGIDEMDNALSKTNTKGIKKQKTFFTNKDHEIIKKMQEILRSKGYVIEEHVNIKKTHSLNVPNKISDGVSLFSNNKQDMRMNDNIYNPNLSSSSFSPKELPIMDIHKSDHNNVMRDDDYEDDDDHYLERLLDEDIQIEKEIHGRDRVYKIEDNDYNRKKPKLIGEEFKMEKKPEIKRVFKEEMSERVILRDNFADNGNNNTHKRLDGFVNDSNSRSHFHKSNSFDKDENHTIKPFERMVIINKNAKDDLNEIYDQKKLGFLLDKRNDNNKIIINLNNKDFQELISGGVWEGFQIPNRLKRELSAMMRTD